MTSVLSDCSDADGESDRALCALPLPSSFITQSSSNKTAGSAPSPLPNAAPLAVPGAMRRAHRPLAEVRSESALRVDDLCGDDMRGEIRAEAELQVSRASLDRRVTDARLPRRDRSGSTARLPRGARSCFIVRRPPGDDDEMGSQQTLARRPSRPAARFFRRNEDDDEDDDADDSGARRLLSRRSMRADAHGSPDSPASNALIRRSSRASMRRAARRVNQSKSLPDASLRAARGDVDDDAAEARARAQFARSRNNAVIWGSARSQGSSTALPADALDALARSLTRAIDAPALARSLRALTASLPAWSSCAPHRNALARAAGLVANASSRRGPPPPLPPDSAPRALAAALPFGDALVLVLAAAAPLARVGVRRRVRSRAGRLACSLVLRAPPDGDSPAAAARVDVAERAPGAEVVDVAVAPATAFGSRRRDALATLVDRFAAAWHDSGLSAPPNPDVDMNPAHWRRQMSFSIR